MASSVCDCCLAFWKRREDSSVSPTPLGIAHRHWHPSLGHVSTPLPAQPQAGCPHTCWGTPASHSLLCSITGRLAHSVCCCCTCCLSSGNWCSHSSPCSRCPDVPCRLSWTCTHSGDVSEGNKRERCALVRVKGKSGYFPHFLPGCSSQPWQEWAQPAVPEDDPSQAFVPPLQGGQGQSRTPPCPSGLPQPSAHRWRGSQRLDGICCCLGVTHTHQIQPCCYVGG